jgi:SulP family sulfate permease
MVPIFEYTGIFIGEQAEHLRHFAELDDALEWCESQMLEVLGGSTEHQFSGKEMLAHIFNDSPDIGSLVSFFTEKKISADQRVFAQGDQADSLYFILSGAITINLKLPMGHHKRLKELHAGSILGEMAFYTGGKRSADAVAREDSVVLQLLVADFKILQQTYPIAAGLLHASVVRLLAQRLSQANQEISALSR